MSHEAVLLTLVQLKPYVTEYSVNPRSLGVITADLGSGRFWVHWLVEGVATGPILAIHLEVVGQVPVRIPDEYAKRDQLRAELLDEMSGPSIGKTEEQKAVYWFKEAFKIAEERDEARREIDRLRRQLGGTS